MNKLLKHFLIGIAVGSVIFASCKAELVKISTETLVGSQSDKTYINNSCDIVCINPNGSTCSNINIAFNLNHGSNAWSIRGGGDIGTTYGFCSPEHTIYYSTFDGCTFNIDCYQITEYSSMQCQTEYNLIPIENVTENYCTANFDLIRPSDCPTGGEGTGDISWSALYINNIQYAGANSIYININDILEYNMTYTEENAIIDVEGLNADPLYIENVITQTKAGATAENLETLITTTEAFVPYLFIALLIAFAVMLIKKFFRG